LYKIFLYPITRFQFIKTTINSDGNEKQNDVTQFELCYIVTKSLSAENQKNLELYKKFFIFFKVSEERRKK